jgi:penicillin-binding protein 1A
VYDDLQPFLSMALGAGETTLLKMVGAYGMIDNGGKKITPTLIDRIQDRWGRTIFRHDLRVCADCTAQSWQGQDEPQLADSRPQIVDPHTAYQITSMMEGVVQRGTGYKVKAVGKPLAGKTGTTNDERDAWFVGFSPDLVVGVFVGYDTPRPMGRGSTGGQVAAPIFKDFMDLALADKPAIPFRVPPGLNFYRISAQTGMRAQPGDTQVLMEAFKPTTQPPDDFSVIGQSDERLPPVPDSQNLGPGFRTGRGGLY